LISAEKTVTVDLASPIPLSDTSHSYYCNKTQMYQMGNVTLSIYYMQAQGYGMVNGTFSPPVGTLFGPEFN